MVTGQYIFGTEELSVRGEVRRFQTDIQEAADAHERDIEEYDMTFFTNAAALNHIYRFISDYRFCCGEDGTCCERQPRCVFPGDVRPVLAESQGDSAGDKR